MKRILVLFLEQPTEQGLKATIDWMINKIISRKRAALARPFSLKIFQIDSLNYYLEIMIHIKTFNGQGQVL